MFHHLRRGSKDFDGHGQRVAALQKQRVGHGTEKDFEEFKEQQQQLRRGRRRHRSGLGCCRAAEVKPMEPDACRPSSSNDEMMFADFKNRKRNECDDDMASRYSSEKTTAMAQLHTMLHQNPEDAGTSMDGVSVETFFKKRGETTASHTRRRGSVVRGIAQATANTKAMARRASGVFARSKRSDARRTTLARQKIRTGR